MFEKDCVQVQGWSRQRPIVLERDTRGGWNELGLLLLLHHHPHDARILYY